jgi:hypothetical protein
MRFLIFKNLQWFFLEVLFVVLATRSNASQQNSFCRQGIFKASKGKKSFYFFVFEIIDWRPILEYCTQIWHYNIPDHLSKDIESIPAVKSSQNLQSIISIRWRFGSFRYSDFVFKTWTVNVWDTLYNICRVIYSAIYIACHCNWIPKLLVKYNIKMLIYNVHLQLYYFSLCFTTMLTIVYLILILILIYRFCTVYSQECCANV